MMIENENHHKVYMIGNYHSSEVLLELENNFENSSPALQKTNSPRNLLNLFDLDRLKMRKNSLTNNDESFKSKVRQWDKTCTKVLGKRFDEMTQLNFPGDSSKKISSRGNITALISMNNDLYMTGSIDKQKKDYVMLGSDCELSLENLQMIREKTLISNLKDISVGYRHSGVICIDGSVWLWGHNQNDMQNITFQLGIANLTKTSKPIKLEADDTLKNLNFSRISIGNEFTILLNNNGKLFSFGKNDKGTKSIIFITSKYDIFTGQLGRSTKTDEERMKPTPININFNLPIRIVDISCGFSHVLAKTTKRYLFAWGSNVFGKKFFFLFTEQLFTFTRTMWN